MPASKIHGARFTEIEQAAAIGLAASAKDAFDLFAVGEREGLNRSEDLLDTLIEYPVVLRKLGLSGQDALGLINQGMKAGARNTDVLADALKEFQIRSIDGSKTTIAGFERLGLSAEDMAAKIARGGSDAREGLDEVLRKLRETEDPVQRNAAAVELFGTKAEDLGDALFALDLSTAVEQLGLVNGAAQAMFDTLSDNDASKMEKAKRNVEVAIEAIQGALASGFSEPLAQAAEWISQNRGPVLQFFSEVANGALDFGYALVEGAAAGTEAFGEFVSGPLADAAEGIAVMLRWLQQYDQADGVQKMVDEMRGFDDSTSDAATRIREDLGGALDVARGKLNDYLDPAIQIGFLSDAAQRTAGAIANLGDEHSTLHQQITDVAAAMRDELSAAAEAGESQEQLAGRYDITTQALVDQMTQMGYTEEEARNVIATYGLVPSLVETTFNANVERALDSTKALLESIGRIPFSKDVIINQVVRETGADRGAVGAAYNALGAILQPMALGGLTPMRPLAQMVPPSTYRVVGDRHDVSELYAPLDGSPRSWSLLMEGFRRMPGVAPMADGGVTGASVAAAGINIGDITARVSTSPTEAELRAMIFAAIEDAIQQWADRKFGRGGL